MISQADDNGVMARSVGGSDTGPDRERLPLSPALGVHHGDAGRKMRLEVHCSGDNDDLVEHRTDHSIEGPGNHRPTPKVGQQLVFALPRAGKSRTSTSGE